MSISAQRFKFLDEETNVPVSNFLTNVGSSILNGPLHDIVDVTEQLQAIVNGDKPVNIDKILRAVASGGLGTSRLTKDFYSSLSDLSRIGTTAVTSISKRLFPGSTILQSAFNQMGEGCKNKLLSGLSNCRNKKAKAKYNGKLLNTTNRSCSADSFINLINKITNGAYNALHVDQCALTKMVAGVAIRGFEIGLPSVFSALSSQIEDKHLLAQTGSMVIGAAALDRNMNAIMDVAGSSVGGMIYSLNPSISSNVLSNFKIPSEIQARDLSSYYGEFKNGMATLDQNWDMTSLNGVNIPDVSNMMGLGKEDLTNMYMSVSGGIEMPDVNLDGFVPDLDQEQLIAAGLQFDPPDATDYLSETFSDVPLEFKDSIVINDSFW